MPRQAACKIGRAASNSEANPGNFPEPNDHFSGDARITVYPTEAQERAKQRKALGHQAVKKKFVVEDNFDDCGKDLSGLGIKS